jgi:hypothetical protein
MERGRELPTDADELRVVRDVWSDGANSLASGPRSESARFVERIGAGETSLEVWTTSRSANATRHQREDGTQPADAPLSASDYLDAGVR